MPPLSFGDGSPSDILSNLGSYFSQGGTAGTVVLASVFGIVVSIAQGGINVVQSIIGLITQPLDAGAAGAAAALRATIVEPLGVLIAGAETSAASITQFGILGLLVGVGIMLAAFWMINQFLEEEETPDWIVVPGLPDLPGIGAEEEGED